jgi:hypothetical protein
VYHGDAGGKNYDVVYLAVKRIFAAFSGEKDIWENGKFTEMREKQNAYLLFACFDLVGHYFFARRKRAELDRQHPKAECNYYKNNAHYKGNEFFHGSNPFT